MERVVVALGGNALLRRGAEDTFEEMYSAARAAAERIADIAAEGWEVVVTHGNGPQVGRILLQQEAAASMSTRCRSTCAAPSARARSATCSRSRSATCSSSAGWTSGRDGPLAHPGPADDPAFRSPTKSVGPFYTEAEAKRLEEQRG